MLIAEREFGDFIQVNCIFLSSRVPLFELSMVLCCLGQCYLNFFGLNHLLCYIHVCVLIFRAVSPEKRLNSKARTVEASAFLQEEYSKMEKQSEDGLGVELHDFSFLSLHFCLLVPVYL